MASLKVLFICGLLALSVAAQKDDKKKANTRSFGFLGGGGGGGGGFNNNGFQGGAGGYNQNLGGGHAGLGGGNFGGGGGFGVGGGLGAGGGFGGNRPKPASCRYWCKTPEGQAYCCENNNQAPKPAIATQIVKGGSCPPVRAQCPLRSFGGPPQPCSNHGSCSGTDRCCYDRCLREHVCKQAIYNNYGK